MIKLKLNKNMNFNAITDSSHIISIDASKENGGKNKGPRPTELLLVGMAGCTAFDLKSYFDKKKIKFKKFHIHISAQRKKKMPTVFKKIFIEYKIQTDRKNKSKIQSKIKYSLNKQCSCCVMLGKSAKVEYKLSIIK